VRVGTRPNPIISLGNVDSSVPLVLCDAAVSDCPIVYCSEPFETLTGYVSSEILGRNCRFLQSPYAGRETTVGSDVNREARAVLREKIAIGEEAQVRLVNYKKSGERFVNLVTIVPISWGEGEQSTGYKRYIVGFQADPNMALS
jgi:PAS domain-containing protein